MGKLTEEGAVGRRYAPAIGGRSGRRRLLHDVCHTFVEELERKAVEPEAACSDQELVTWDDRRD